MKLREAVTKQDIKLFLSIPKIIYRNDANWIQPLDKDIEEVFDGEKNKFLKRGGVACRWVLEDSMGKPIGRVAAFVNKQYRQEQPTGGIGFFECIDDQAAADLIFDTCKSWLAERGMEAMDGPINFGERDRWWGLLVEGFHPALYCMNYNPPYYQKLFENYGFKNYFNQICFGMKVADNLDEKFYRRHAAIAADTNFRAEHFKKKDLEKYALDFCEVYNKAFVVHGEGKSLEPKAAIKMFQTMAPVIDEKIVWYAYYQDKPIAVWINLPDLNFFFKSLNGKFGLMEKLRFLLLKWRGNCDRFVGLVFGVVVEFQGKGVDSYIIVEAAKTILKTVSYKEYEMQWIGDFNVKMVNIAENLGTNRTRKLTTYRYLFDRNKEFKRHRILG
jgi:hypothetical protein